MLYYEELFTRSTCSSCQQEIPGLGIECVECQGGNFKICPECFATLAEIGQHKSEHRYRFFDSGSLVLFPSSATEVSSTKENESGSQSQRWSAREEIRLLDAIEQYGFGNWCDISKHIETKTSTETKKEFVERFIQGNIGVCTWDDKNNTTDDNSSSSSEFRRTSIGLFPKPVDHTLPCDEGPLSPSLTQKLPPLDISSEEMLQLGYMPFRDDYEKEYDNEAEKLVAQLAFTAEDDEVDVGLKLALVDMYASRLRERARRKRIIRDYQLVSKFFKKDRAKVNGGGGESNGGTQAGSSNNGANNKDSNKRFLNYEKNLQDKLKPFAQFYNSREFDNMIKNLVKEKELKLRLQELYKYRSNGITRADECVDFERSKVAASLRGKRTAAMSGLGTLEEDDETEDRSHKKALLMQKSPVPPTLMQQFLQPKVEPLSPPGMSPQGAGSTGNESVERNKGSANQSLTQQPFSRDDCNSKSSESSGLELALLPQLLLESGAGGAVAQPMDQQGHQELLNSSLPNERQKAWGGQYTADFVPGSEQLTEAEYNLCLQVNILPAQFLTIKLAHILGKIQASNSTSSNPQSQKLREPPPDIDNNEWKRITDFLSTSSFDVTEAEENALCTSTSNEPNNASLSLLSN